MSQKTLIPALMVLAAGASWGQAHRVQWRAAERLIVQHREGVSDATLQRTLSAHGASLERRLHSNLHSSVIHVSERNFEQVRQSLENSGLFTFVEPDYLAFPSTVPNDPSFPSQWHLNTIQAPSAWSMTTGSSSVTIAFIDSGVDTTHPDLSSKLVPGWNFLAGSAAVVDTEGHGTATAGTAAAATDNGTGVAGVTWGGMIMPLVVLSSSDFAYYSDIANAMTYAADHGARVINISISGTSASSTLQSAVNYAWSKGVVVVAAAGNGASSAPMYPAACDNVVAVSATDQGDNFASFSSFGTWVDLSAPGTPILTTNRGGGYGWWQGTSFSSPIVAATAALVLSVRPSLSNTAVVQLLEQNADDLGTPGYDQYFGWGRVNAYKAVLAATSASVTQPPTVTLSAPTNGSTVAATVQVQGTATTSVGLNRVEYYLDGNLMSTSYASPFAFNWDTTTSSNAAHNVVVKAYDTAGNTGQASASVTVKNPTPADTQPPTVWITSPTTGTHLASSGSVSIRVSASDNVGVSKVCIYIDGVQVYSSSSAPYSYSWNLKKVGWGQHTITAKAWDRAGNWSASSPVIVTK